MKPTTKTIRAGFQLETLEDRLAMSLTTSTLSGGMVFQAINNGAPRIAQTAVSDDVGANDVIRVKMLASPRIAQTAVSDDVGANDVIRVKMLTSMVAISGMNDVGVSDQPNSSQLDVKDAVYRSMGNFDIQMFGPSHSLTGGLSKTPHRMTDSPIDPVDYF
ncbi:MAG: hypothetical protein ACKO23_21595 [Gemmataceae bacterium]